MADSLYEGWLHVAFERSFARSSMPVMGVASTASLALPSADPLLCNWPALADEVAGGALSGPSITSWGCALGPALRRAVAPLGAVCDSSQR